MANVPDKPAPQADKKPDPMPAPKSSAPYRPDPDEETDTVVVPPKPQSTGLVTVTVTKFGAGKVSTGEHIAGQGDIYASQGAKLTVTEDAAKALEKKGLVETD